MRTGDKVKIKTMYILDIAKRDFKLARYLSDKTGIIVGFDDITWYFSVDFEDEIFSFRRFQLEEI